jgi:transposase
MEKAKQILNLQSVKTTDMNYILGGDRNQMQFLALEEMVAEDSWARVIDVFVDLLPLKDLGFKHAKLQKEGRPPYDPSQLLKLYLYGYKHSIRSSRKMEHACIVNVELWWLLKGLKPSFRSIAYFRKDNAAALKAAFRYFVIMLQDMELIEGETIAIDSFKVRAQNNFRKNYNQAKIDRHIEYIDTKIEQYQHELEQADAIEKEELKIKITKQRGRREKYEKIEEQLQECGDTQISTTDPDAKALRVNNNGTEVGYLIQAATDAKYKLFVHADIGGKNDKRELAPMSLEVKHLLDLRGFKTLSDAGYSTGDQFRICKEADIETYSAPMPTTSPSQDCIPTSEFTYNKINDCYICPSGEVMNKVGNSTTRRNYKAFIYKTTACRACSIREECTKNKQGRIIERTEYQDVIDENRERVLANRDYYKLRQQIIEHQFGVLKRQWGFTYTLLKGKNNVLSEVHLMMIIYNLTRMIKILGKEVLKRLLATLCASLFAYISTFITKSKPIWKNRKHLTFVLNLDFITVKQKRACATTL